MLEILCLYDHTSIRGAVQMEHQTRRDAVSNGGRGELRAGRPGRELKLELKLTSLSTIAILVDGRPEHRFVVGMEPIRDELEQRRRTRACDASPTASTALRPILVALHLGRIRLASDGGNHSVHRQMLRPDLYFPNLACPAAPGAGHTGHRGGG